MWVLPNLSALGGKNKGGGEAGGGGHGQREHRGVPETIDRSIALDDDHDDGVLALARFPELELAVTSQATKLPDGTKTNTT